MLVHKLKGEFYCTSLKCSHFGVPLKFGFSTAEDFVATCPAHNAGFCIKTGNALRGPVQKGIDTYPVSVDRHGKVIVKVYPQEKFRKPAARNPKNQERIVIVGSGAAG